MTNLKINTTNDEAQKLAKTYGIGQDIVNEFEYKDEPVLINVRILQLKPKTNAKLEAWLESKQQCLIKRQSIWQRILKFFRW